ncbi:hypothetical protein WJX72_003622 [[Myrmecia] bisecta]|uniref:Flagellar M-ring N-terminal domain-containing protein n=1 Tax=[Myrmecia] bisecta TaxID=41462 RepID=A0AAW1P2K8_9CHLO
MTARAQTAERESLTSKVVQNLSRDTARNHSFDCPAQPASCHLNTSFDHQRKLGVAFEAPVASVPGELRPTAMAVSRRCLLTAACLLVAVLPASAETDEQEKLEAMVQLRAPDGLPVGTVMGAMADLLERDLLKDFMLVSVKKISSADDVAREPTVLQDLDAPGRRLQQNDLDLLFTEDGSMSPLSHEDMDFVLEQYAKQQSDLHMKQEVIELERASQYDMQYMSDELPLSLDDQAYNEAGGAAVNSDDHTADRAIYAALGSNRMDVEAEDGYNDGTYSDYLEEDYPADPLEEELAEPARVADDENASLAYLLWSHRLQDNDSFKPEGPAEDRSDPLDFPEPNFFDYDGSSQHDDDELVWAQIAAEQPAMVMDTATGSDIPATDSAMDSDSTYVEDDAYIAAFIRERRAAGLDPILDTMLEPQAISTADALAASRAEATKAAASSGLPTASVISPPRTAAMYAAASLRKELITYVITLEIRTPDAKATQAELGNLISEETLSQQLAGKGLQVTELAVFFANERVYAPVPKQVEKVPTVRLSLRDVMAGIETRKQAQQMLEASRQQAKPVNSVILSRADGQLSMLGGQQQLGPVDGTFFSDNDDEYTVTQPQLQQRQAEFEEHIQTGADALSGSSIASVFGGLILTRSSDGAFHILSGAAQKTSTAAQPASGDSGRSPSSGVRAWMAACTEELMLAVALVACLTALVGLFLVARASQPALQQYAALPADEENPEDSIANPLVVVDAKSWIERIEREDLSSGRQ